MVASICKQCSSEIASGVDCIGCEGYCNDFYHAACVKFTREDLIRYRQIPNLWWMCNECRDTIRKHRNDHSVHVNLDTPENTPKESEITRIDGELAELKEQIAAIHQSLLVQNTASRIETIEPTAEHSNAHHPLAESSLLSLPDIQQGTKLAGYCGSVVEQTSSNDRFWLFFTRVKNCVTEQQISELVADSLGTNDAVIKKLVPAWRNTLSMPYVSFKVGVHIRLKEIALRPSTWPTGLCFREFRENVWQPL